MDVKRNVNRMNPTHHVELRHRTIMDSQNFLRVGKETLIT